MTEFVGDPFNSMGVKQQQSWPWTQVALFPALGRPSLGVTRVGHCFLGNNPLKVSPPSTLTTPKYLTPSSTLQGAIMEDMGSPKLGHGGLWLIRSLANGEHIFYNLCLEWQVHPARLPGVLLVFSKQLKNTHSHSQGSRPRLTLQVLTSTHF